MRFLVALILVLGSAACEGAVAESGNESLRGPTMSEQIARDVQTVRQRRILFSHHSVGHNLLSGLSRLSAKAGGALNVVSMEKGKGQAGPALIEVSGGRNQHPESKVDFFGATIRTQPLRPDLAFMKFCYVDFDPHTDEDALFAYYRKAMDALKQEHPEIVFAHITVPLVTRPMEIKERIFRLIGREVWEDTANTKRHHFNQRLLKEYAADPIFDLARAESTRPDGTRQTFDYEGRVYYSLVPRYTNDDGHLNQAGQDAVAPELLRFMANAAKQFVKPPS